VAARKRGSPAGATTLGEAPTGNEGKRPSSASRETSQRLVSVTSGRICIGHIVCRGKLGFEAYDRDDQSLGIFPTLNRAANALSKREGSHE
jgi:hypothetical protein